MALYGVVYAVLENDIRRLLAYHIVSQVGYMVAGVGIGSALALNGAVAHAFCHILYKALLFMGAGAVIQTTGKRKLTELGGMGQHMWLVVGLYMVGAFSISGVPLFSGFISKSMILSAAAEAHRPVAEILLTLASVGTFLSIGLKLPYFTFFSHAQGGQPQPAPRNMLLAMSASGLLCLALGIFPAWLYARLPFAAAYHPYTVDHVVSSLQLLLGTALGFWWLLPKLRPKPTRSLDTDWLYRVPLVHGCQALIAMARHTGETLAAGRTALLRIILPYLLTPALLRQLKRVSRSCVPVTNDVPTSPLPIGVTVFWIVVLFTVIALYAQ
jgi:multicomponent Na+:H+ antiporter subunit D